MTNLDTGGRGLDRRPYRVDRRTTVGLTLQRTPGAYFSWGNIWNADFRDATLQGRQLKNAILRGTDFSGADLRNAVLDSTSFIRTSPTFPMPIYAARPSTAALWTNGTTCAAESIDACRV